MANQSERGPQRGAGFARAGVPAGDLSCYADLLYSCGKIDIRLIPEMATNRMRFSRVTKLNSRGMAGVRPWPSGEVPGLNGGAVAVLSILAKKRGSDQSSAKRLPTGCAFR